MIHKHHEPNDIPTPIINHHQQETVKKNGEKKKNKDGRSSHYSRVNTEELPSIAKSNRLDLKQILFFFSTA
jgi:hypothetical protein